jgi:hypothetical protein
MAEGGTIGAMAAVANAVELSLYRPAFGADAER